MPPQAPQALPAWSGRSCQKPRPGSLGRPTRCPRSLRGVSGPLSGPHALQAARRLPERLLRLRRPRAPSRRAVKDAALTERIEALHARSRGTYGSPRIRADLVEEEVHVGRKRTQGDQRMDDRHAVGGRGANQRDAAVRPSAAVQDRERSRPIIERAAGLQELVRVEVETHTVTAKNPTQISGRKWSLCTPAPRTPPSVLGASDADAMPARAWQTRAPRPESPWVASCGTPSATRSVKRCDGATRLAPLPALVAMRATVVGGEGPAGCTLAAMRRSPSKTTRLDRRVTEAMLLRPLRHQRLLPPCVRVVAA